MYIFAALEYLQEVLNTTSWSRLHVMSDTDHLCQLAKFSSVINFLTKQYGAVLDNGNSSALELRGAGKSTSALTESMRAGWNVTDYVFDVIHDIAMLATYKKLILPKSSFAFWGGFLSDATEVSVM